MSCIFMQQFMQVYQETIPGPRLGISSPTLTSSSSYKLNIRTDAAEMQKGIVRSRHHSHSPKVGACCAYCNLFNITTHDRVLVTASTPASVSVIVPAIRSVRKTLGSDQCKSCAHCAFHHTTYFRSPEVQSTSQEARG